MDLQSELTELRSAWRALGGEEHTEGWRTIPIGTGARPMRAGRHYPGDTEAVLIGFRNLPPSSLAHFPKGRGFFVARVDLDSAGAGPAWIALAREHGANHELFAAMAEDVVSMLADHATATDQATIRLFVERIAAWQSFMHRDAHHGLSGEMEVGLAGELVTLIDIIDAGVSPERVVGAWQGPIDGVQDFMFRGGVVEVKSTIAHGNFPARISSLEQLDDKLVSLLFLAAVRLSLSSKGRTLPEIAADARNAVAGDPAALNLFETRLIHGGLLPGLTEEYIRKFQRIETTVVRVAGEFPRLVHANVPPEIRSAGYELDLALIAVPDTTLQEALLQLGAFDGTY